MNRENIEKLITVLAGIDEEEFDIAAFPPVVSDGTDPLECGTPACIGGWCARLLISESGADPEMGYGIEEYLGIDRDMYYALTIPGVANNDAGLDFQRGKGITVAMAIRALRNILDGCRPREVWNGCIRLRGAPAADALE